MNDSYTALSKYYDRLMEDFDYDDIVHFILSSGKYKTGLDLACGSGTATIMLSSGGILMTGLDKCTELLSVAAIKAREVGEKITFIEGDLNNLDEIRKYDLITAVCDGFNYISQDKIKHVFTNVYNMLNDIGTFVFDISTAYKLTEIIGNNLFYEDLDDLTYYWNNKLYKNKVDFDLTFFELGKDGRYDRRDENHTQYIHDTQKLLDTLKAIGFTVEVYDASNFGSLRSKSVRAIFVCKKEK